MRLPSAAHPMFFFDSAGFFSLVSVIIQSLLAWVFVGLFSAMGPRESLCLSRWRLAFAALGLALVAVASRFVLAHVFIADGDALTEGQPFVRALYSLYLAGKLTFVWLLAGGVAALRQGAWPRNSGSWGAGLFCVAGLVGGSFATVESLLLVQAVAVIVGFSYAAWLLRARPGEADEAGRRIVLWGLVGSIAMCALYAACVVALRSGAKVGDSVWGEILRVNPLVDVLLQVLLATGLVVLVLQESQRAALAVLHERDQLREQVQRDDKVRSLSALVSGVAHEINNPLTAILGFADDLGDESAEVRNSAAQIVKEQAERCRGIVQRLSILGRRAPVVRVPVDIEALVGRVVGGFRPQFAPAGVALVVDVAAGLRPLLADPTALEQVLTNLLANALQVSPRGAQVTIRAVADEAVLELVVADQGPGVPMADRARIFEPFWTTKHTGQGTGLGLAVARALVQAHEGILEVGDAPGGGASFRVCLPWMTNASSPAAVAAPESVAPPVVGRSGLRLLVVDDQQIVRATIVRQAEQDGWLTSEAASAEMALAKIFDAGEGYDAIVCDLRMPGISGIGFHDELAVRAPQVLQRVVFVTGDLASAEAAAFAARCRSPILTKPFVFRDLFSRLRELVSVG